MWGSLFQVIELKRLKDKFHFGGVIMKGSEGQPQLRTPISRAPPTPLRIWRLDNEGKGMNLKTSAAEGKEEEWRSTIPKK